LHRVYNTVGSLAKELTASSKSGKNENKLNIETNKPNSSLKILFPINKGKIQVTHALAHLIGSSITLGQTTYAKKLNSPSNYFTHCDLIDKNQNFLNNKTSDILATFDVKGLPYEKVSYEASLQQPFRDCLTASHVNSITVSVRDQDGEQFNFNGLPLE